MNLVYVGIPFYNAEKYLDYAIRSVLNQTYINWKMTLIDDGSTDSSLALARKYTSDTRVKVISDGRNKGLVYRLNELVKLSDCKYFVRMDADDIMHPQRLEKQLRYLEEHPQADVVGSWAYSIDTGNRVVGILKNKVNPSVIGDVFAHACFIHPSVMGKRDWFSNNPYDSRYIRVEDMELWCRTIEKSNFYNLSEPLLFYREIGVPYLYKYLLSMKGVRTLIIKYYSANLLKRYGMLIINYVKCLLYALFTVFGLQNILIKRRSNSISFKLKTEASSKLMAVIK
nr:glycosyltransferase family 2 protein [Bacteroides intestinalis]